MYTLKLEHHFDAAHKLENYNGPCSNIHGHSFKILIEIQTLSLAGDMVIDFKELKQVINEKYDHTYINDKVKFNPTAENISKNIHLMVIDILSKKGYIVEGHNKVIVKVTIWENAKASITYTE